MSTFKYAINGISGIWNSYGCIPEPGKSVSISLEDHGNGSGSLKDLCGFDGTPQDIGQLADSKEISELVIVLPFVMFDTTPPYFDGEFIQTVPAVVDPCSDCLDNDPCSDEKPPTTKNKKNDKRYFGLYWSDVEQSYLFQIKKEIINKILGSEDYTKLSIYDVKEIIEHKQNINKNNNIVKLIIAMVNYNVPPHLNWLLDSSIPPLAFYTAEYKHVLSKKDLSDIWQGTMPDIAQNPQEEEDIEIEHFLSEEEIFGGYDINNYDIKMRIFKCKKRANYSYNKHILGKQDNKSKIKWYNSNWPYDNFSLIELLKVEAGEIHDYTVSGSNPINVNGVLNGTTSRTYVDNNGITRTYTPSLYD